MSHFNPDDFSRFSDFAIHTTTYKTVSDHQITTDVLIPSSLTSASAYSPSATTQPLPVIIRFHGGGFICASSLFPDFFGRWLLEFALKHSAIIVSPNYRLLPEASMHELLEDMEDHWAWVQAELPSFVQKQTNGVVSADTSRIIAAGESAGGYFSMMLGLSHPDKIKAVMGAYPMVDLRHRYYIEAYEKSILGMSQLPRSIVDGHLEQIRKGEIPAIISSDPRIERIPIMLSYLQQGLFKSHFPEEDRALLPFARLEDGARFPRGGVFVWHGKEDSVVPVEGSTRLQELIQKVDPALKFRLTLRSGDHGFDADTKITDDWMAEGLKDIRDAWLA